MDTWTLQDTRRVVSSVPMVCSFARKGGNLSSVHTFRSTPKTQLFFLHALGARRWFSVCSQGDPRYLLFLADSGGADLPVGCNLFDIGRFPVSLNHTDFVAEKVKSNVVGTVAANQAGRVLFRNWSVRTHTFLFRCSVEYRNLRRSAYMLLYSEVVW